MYRENREREGRRGLPVFFENFETSWDGNFFFEKYIVDNLFSGQGPDRSNQQFGIQNLCIFFEKTEKRLAKIQKI